MRENVSPHKTRQSKRSLEITPSKKLGASSNVASRAQPKSISPGIGICGIRILCEPRASEIATLVPFDWNFGSDDVLSFRFQIAICCCACIVFFLASGSLYG